MNGYTPFLSQTVHVRDDVDPAQATKTLAHELGHIRADHDHRFPDYATSEYCHGQAELEAESIAYLVAASAGLDTTNYSLPYLACWSDGHPERLRESATQVLTVARAIGVPDAADGRAESRSGWRTTAPGGCRSPTGRRRCAVRNRHGCRRPRRGRGRC